MSFREDKLINKSKSWDDFRASLAVMNINIHAYYRGKLAAYRPLAVELRKLLCDTSCGKDISLIHRLFPDLHLKPLSGDVNKIDSFTSLYIPGRMYFNGGGDSNLWDLFNEDASSVELSDWLQQKLLNNSITIKEFIRSVADKEGAHSDEVYNATLLTTQSVAIANEPLSAKTIVTIARFILKTLVISLINQNISSVRSSIMDQFEQAGKGIAVINLDEFSSNFTDDSIPIVYKPIANPEELVWCKKDMQEKVFQIVESNDFSTKFIILIVDFNNEIWILEQKYH
jgi:hypothetical protein